MSKLARYAETYLRMANEINYRPEMQSDLSSEELNDPAILKTEARKYAERFGREEDTDHFFIGCSNWDTNRAFVLVIEAARLLASGCADGPALELLRKAIAEVEKCGDFGEGQGQVNGNSRFRKEKS